MDITMRKIIFILTVLCVMRVESVYALDLSADCAYLMTADSRECLYEKNGDAKHSMASTTKIMTAISAIEMCNLDEVVTVSANAESQEGSSVYLRTGNEIKLLDLIYGMLLNSGNDAACAVAEHAGGSVEDFAKIMNDNALRIGAKNTAFKNPSGLDDEGHYSTAHDMALIAAYAMENSTFREIVSTKTSQINVGSDICYLKNHNKLLWNYEGCSGVKTGYTKKTGRCLVSAAERNGITLIAVTLGAPDDWNDHKKMLDYGFENTELKTVLNKGEVLKEYTLNGGSFNAVAENDITVSIKKNSALKADVVLHAVNKPTLSIQKGEKVGYAECFIGEYKIADVNLISDNSAEGEPIKKDNNIWAKIKKLLLKL